MYMYKLLYEFIQKYFVVHVGSQKFVQYILISYYL